MLEIEKRAKIYKYDDNYHCKTPEAAIYSCAISDNNDDAEENTIVFNSKRSEKCNKNCSHDNPKEFYNCVKQSKKSHNKKSTKSKLKNEHYTPLPKKTKKFVADASARIDYMNSSNENAAAKTNESEANSPKKQSGFRMAEILSALYDYVVFDNQLYQYNKDEGFWKMIPGNDANRELRKSIPPGLEHGINKNMLNESYEWLCTIAEPLQELGTPESKHYLNFKDGALNWKTMDFVKKRKEFYFRYALNLNYRSLPSSKGYYKNFLNDVFGEDKKTRREFSKFLGLCLSDIRNLKYAFFLYGPSNSGKSVVLNVLKALVRESYCSSISFSQMGNEFAITELVSKRLNISGEVSGASNKRLDIFKSITGNDKITASYKGKDHFQFKNESLLVFACNVFPNVNSPMELEAFLSRIIIFPFLNVKPRSEWIDNLEELLLEDKGSIIFDAIEGLRLLEKDNYCFKESKAMKLCKMEFQGLYDSFSLFADKHLVADIESIETSQRLNDAYKTFCNIEGYHPLADNIWPQLLKQRFVCKQKIISVQNGQDSKRIRAYAGIRLNFPDDDIPHYYPVNI